MIYYLTVYNFFSIVVPDKFEPFGAPIKIEGEAIGGSTTDKRYLYYDFSKHFGEDKNSVAYKEIVLYPGQYLGMVEGHVGYT